MTIEVRIDRLNLRLSGLSPEAARRLATDLGPALRSQLSRIDPMLGRAADTKFTAINLGNVRLQKGAGPGEIKATAARAVAKAITARLASNTGGS